MSYTRAQWALALLIKIGNSNPSEQTVQWVVSWTRFETSNPPGAQYNLLNTTEPFTPGIVSDFNSVGVKNFDSFEHGIQANAKVLANGYYPDLYTALRTNNVAFLVANAVMINPELSTWGTGPVQASIVAGMGQGMNDAFPGEALIPVPVPTVDPLWTKWINAPAHTGIYNWWLKDSALYGAPLTGEYGPTMQEFENASVVWINGNPHWRFFR